MSVRTLPLRLAHNAPAIIIILLLVDSLHFVFARLLLPHLPPVSSAFYVIAVATAEMTLYLGFQGKIRLRVLWQNRRFFLTIGFLVAGATILSYTAVAFIDPGTASLLAQSATLFAIGFSLFWLKERLNIGELAGASLAIVGVFTISFQAGEYLRLGALIVLGGSFMYALHAAVVKRYGQEIDFANFFLYRVSSIGVFLFFFAVGMGQLRLPDGPTWLLLLVVGSVDVLLSRVLYYLALRRLRMSFHAILLTLSPVITILWSLMLFGTWPTTQVLIGGTAVISGVAIVTMRRSA
jgi:drug/metabolite transporter (DMT)-like permease